jgi:exonuclease SbcC
MALENFRVRLDEAGIALENARIEKKTADIGYEQAVKEAEDLAQEIRENRNAALEDVRPFGVTGLTPANLNTVLKDLAARKNVWQVRADKKIAYEKEVADLKAKMEKSLALLGKLETDLAGIRKERENLKAGYESLSAARRWLFGEKDADSEEKRLAGMVNQAEEAQEAARAAYGRTEKEISSLKEKIATLKERTENRAKELARSEQELMERIRKAGFEDEADYHASCLSAEERKILEDKENSLTRKKTELEARRKDRSEALAAEREKGLADRPIDSLRTELAGCESALKELQEGIGAIKNRLSENEKLREKQQQHLEIVDAQKKECARWDELHQLIGSADGKKFRNFAQGLTFEIMVAHANRQLLKMTDRYMLTRDIDDPLELNVIDNYQAGEIRSTKNLSGGESFIVSLSLALGLSQMASRNVRVDSLFLDEGFGTLDEDALETALETLGSLQQDGKLIGVISHVPALKERIGTQIQVIPQTGGRSIIEGPGCSARRGTSAGLT